MNYSFPIFCSILLVNSLCIHAQNVSSVATESLQQSENRVVDLPSQPLQMTLAAGTSVEVEAAHTVSSSDIKAGELISFRVLIPIMVEGIIVIDKGSLVTGRVVEAKRNGHWGHPGRFSWVMQDVLAADGSRLSVQPEALALRDQTSKVKTEPKTSTEIENRNTVKGTGHGGEIATKAIILGAVFPPLAGLGLLQGFKRGENAVLPEGKRFVVLTRNDAKVMVRPQP